MLLLQYPVFITLLEQYRSRGDTELDIVFDMTYSERVQNVVHANRGFLQLNDIRDMILKELDLGSIQDLEAGFHKVSRPPGIQAETIAVERFRIALLRYFPEPSAFATIMLQTGTIIGGSTALSIVEGGAWVPEDLDLIVMERYFNRLREYLVKQGFVMDIVLRRRPAPGYETNSRQGRFSYRRFTKNPLKIDVSICSVEGSNMTPASFILRYHFSFAMNFVSGEGAYSFFAAETFKGRGYRNKNAREERLERVIMKYAARGYMEIMDDRFDPSRPIYLQERFPCSNGTRLMIKDVENIWSMKLPLSTMVNRRP